jgi:hypothetical protein
MDLDNLNENDLDLLTEMIIKRLLYKFKNEIHHTTPMNIVDVMEGFLPFKETDEEFLVAEVARLMTLLAMYEDKEEYMKAAMIKRKLDIVQRKLDKL